MPVLVLVPSPLVSHGRHKHSHRRRRRRLRAGSGGVTIRVGVITAVGIVRIAVGYAVGVVVNGCSRGRWV